MTNKPRTFSLALLETLGVATRFGTVVGGDDAARKKPHPEPVLHALRALAVTPAEAVMVGDSDADVSAARAASTSCPRCFVGGRPPRDDGDTAFGAS